MDVRPSPHNPPQTLPVDADQIVLAALAEHDVPGCSVGVVHGQHSWVGAYGLARVEPELAFLPSTRMPVASMTKPFTAVAVMALVESGDVDLDAPVRRYLPGFRVADATASEQVTVRHLLIHRAGWLGDEPELLAGRGDGALAAQVASYGSLPQVLPPGTTFSYANTALGVAGRLIEVVEEAGYESVLQRRIFEPLGMASSTFFAEQVVSAPAAAGHVRRHGRLEPVQDPWLMPRGVNPAGGLISTAGDQLRWLRWWLGLLDDATGPLTPDTRRRMITELAPVGAIPASTGLGWHVDHVGGVDSIYHEGSIRGTVTVARFVPSAGVGVVVLTNADDGELVYRAVCDRLLRELAGVEAPEPVLELELAEPVLAEYAGRYETRSVRGEPDSVQVEVRSGRLAVCLTNFYLDEPVRFTAARREPDVFSVLDGAWRGSPVEFLREPGGALWGMRVAGHVFLLSGNGVPEGSP